MRKIEERVEARMECTLEDLFEFGFSTEIKARFRMTRDALQGIKSDGKFRLPKNIGHEIFFNNRELATRVTSMCSPDQEALYDAIVDATDNLHVDHLHVTFPWSSKKDRILKIYRYRGSHIDIFL